MGYLEEISETVSSRLDDENYDSDYEAFKDVFIPQSLHEVVDIEKDFVKLNMDQDEKSNCSNSDNSDDDNSSECSSSDEENESKKSTAEVPWMFVRNKTETPEQRRERKQAVKKLQKESRESKKTQTCEE